ncbi:hypothetical protein G9A89_004227 [Geosiphon pyriformis]|nr:hypothetical protein G9A89_004227 [Geosiphon pyriformis]
MQFSLGGLLNTHLCSLHKQANKDHWKYNFKNTNTALWLKFREVMVINAAIFSDDFMTANELSDLDSMWDVIHKTMCFLANEVFKKKWFKEYDRVFTKSLSKFHKLELLVFKLVRAFCSVNNDNFVLLLNTWEVLDSDNAVVIRSLFLSDSFFNIIYSVLSKVRKSYRASKLLESKRAEESQIRSAIEKRMESFVCNKCHTIRSVLKRPFHKVVLDHLVIGDELILEPDPVKSKVDKIMEGWTRKCSMVLDISEDWFRQYQSLDHVFDGAFSDVMACVSFNELFGVVSNLPDGKAAGLLGISNELWKHCDISVLGMFLVLINFCLSGESKILSKILSDRISLACSKFDVFYGDNFSVLKGTTTQFPIFAIDHLRKSLIRIKIYSKFIRFFGGIHGGHTNWVMTNFGLTDGYCVHNDLDQGEVFSFLLWHIFYYLLLCKVKRQESVCGYRLNSYYVVKTGHVESQAGSTSFFAAGVFMDDTIWVGSSQVATQHILNIASEFFWINNISINNDKTVAISINCRVVNSSLLISGAPILITKKGKSYHYLGIFLSTEDLLQPSLAKAHLDVRFFANLVLKKAISNKQFSYLVSAVFYPIISYRIQFSFVPLNVCSKWDALICKSLKFKAGLPWDFPNDALHHPSLYGLKTFEQIQAKCKSASVMCFANSGEILGCLFLHRSHELQFCDGTPMSLYGVAFVEQLCGREGGVFEWVTFKRWKRLDPRGPISDWFVLSIKFLGNMVVSSMRNLLMGGADVFNVLNFIEFVYTDSSLSGLESVNMRSGVVVFFDNINMDMGVKISGLMSSTLAELQMIALALECVPVFSSVSLFLDSQVVLDACRSELSVSHPDFYNRCWIKCCYIANFVCSKRLKITWHKVKSHSGNFGNNHADELAGHAVFSNLILPSPPPLTFCSQYFLFYSLSALGIWFRSAFVWHPDSHMAAGSTSKHTAGIYTYFIKALHRRLPVAVHKRLYNRSYPSVICLFCGCVEVSDHKNISSLCHSTFSVSQFLSSCVLNTLFHIALCKEFVFKEWFHEAVSVFGDFKNAGVKVVNFVRALCLAFRDEIWSVHAKHHAFIEKRNLIPYDSSMPDFKSGLSFIYSAGVIKLLGIDVALGVSFGFCRFSLFISDAFDVVSISISA